MGEPDIFDTARKEEYFVKILNEYEKLVFSVCFRMTQHYFDAGPYARNISCFLQSIAWV